jgi:hypothetical protein
VTRLGPGPELEEAVRKGKAAYDEWEQKQLGCQDRHGRPLRKPQYILVDLHDNYKHEFMKAVLAHNKRCVKCRAREAGEPNGLRPGTPIYGGVELDGYPEPEAVQAERPDAEAE